MTQNQPPILIHRGAKSANFYNKDYKGEKILVCVCVCIIKLLCHFLPDLAQILNKAMNSIGAASKPVPGADFIQHLILLRNYFYALLLERHMIDKCSCEATRYK